MYILEEIKELAQFERVLLSEMLYLSFLSQIDGHSKIIPFFFLFSLAFGAYGLSNETGPESSLRDLPGNKA